MLFVCAQDFRWASEKQALWVAQELVRQGHSAMISVAGDVETASTESVLQHPELVLREHRFRGRWVRREDVAAALDFQPSLIYCWTSRVSAVGAVRSFLGAVDVPVFVRWEDDEWGLRRGQPTIPAIRKAGRVMRRSLATVSPRLWPYSTLPSIAWARRRAAGLDAVAPALAAHVAERTGRSCTAILPVNPPAADPPSDAPVELPPEALEGDLVVYTGELNPGSEHDLRLGLRALAVAQAQGHEIRFVQVGGHLPRYDPPRMAEAAGMRPGTAFFLGYRPFDFVPLLLRQASIALQPGHPTSFNRLRLPTKLQAYLTSGTPTITFGVGFGELVEDRREALVTHTGDPSELAGRVMEVLTDDALRETLSAGAVHAANRLFDPERNTRRLVEHYREGLRRSRG